MTYLFILLALGFSALMLFQIVRPFLVSRTEQLHFELLDEDLRQIEALMAKKAALVQTLRDLEYDYETAKITTEDYKRFRRSCERQAVGIMRRLDTIHGGKDWRAEIERLLQDSSIPQPSAHSDEASRQAQETPPANKVATAPDASSALIPGNLPCPKCATPLRTDDKFCSQCGTPLLTTPDNSDDSAFTSSAANALPPSKASMDASTAALSR